MTGQDTHRHLTNKGRLVTVCNNDGSPPGGTRNVDSSDDTPGVELGLLMAAFCLLAFAGCTSEKSRDRTSGEGAKLTGSSLRTGPTGDMGRGAAFDPDSLERTIRWADGTRQKLEGAGQNELALANIIKDEQEKMNRLNVVGKQVRWKFPIERITKEHVELLAIFKVPGRNWALLCVTELPIHDSRRRNILAVGRDISTEQAAKLRPGEVFEVRAEVKDIRVDHHGTYTVVIVGLEPVRVTE